MFSKHKIQRSLSHSLLPQHAQPLRSTYALIGSVLHKQRLGPESQTGFTVLADQVKRWDDDTATAFTSVIFRFVDDGPDTLVHLAVDDWNGGLALLESVLVVGAEDVG